MTTKLHYIYDPLCGWCYAAAPLVSEASKLFDVVAHGGGMLSGARRRKISSGWREHVMPHDMRIAEVSGQPFGSDYFDKLLRDQDALLDSDPPIAAIMTTERMSGQGLEMLSRVQTAHYVAGRRISEHPVLVEIAGSMGLAREPFNQLLKECLVDGLQSHLSEAHRLLSIIGRQSYPTFILERPSGLIWIESASYLGKTEAWRRRLQDLASS